MHGTWFIIDLMSKTPSKKSVGKGGKKHNQIFKLKSWEKNKIFVVRHLEEEEYLPIELVVNNSSTNILEKLKQCLPILSTRWQRILCVNVIDGKDMLRLWFDQDFFKHLFRSLQEVEFILLDGKSDRLFDQKKKLTKTCFLKYLRTFYKICALSISREEYFNVYIKNG